MELRKKLGLSFIMQLLLTGLLLFIIAAAVTVWVIVSLNDLEAERDLGLAGLPGIFNMMQIEDGEIRFDEKQLEQVKRNEGWLQALDANGRVLHSFNTPDDLPQVYTAGELQAYWTNQIPFPYHLYIWIADKQGARYTLLYGIRKHEETWIALAAAEGQTADGKLLLPDALKRQIADRNGWLQLLDEQGNEIASYGKPDGMITNYTTQDLILRTRYPDRYNAYATAHFDAAAKQIWIASVPFGPPETRGQKPLIAPEIKMLIIAVGCLLILSMLVFIALSFWYAHRFGTPILHVMDWLKALADGKYIEPTDKQGKPLSLHKNGKIKRKYRLFSDLISGLSSLSRSLRRSKEIEQQTQSYREEWIAGVSHDLKTPLASIQGFAHLLETAQYDWSAEEVRGFAAIMLQKSIYMDQLINDLGLTYQLRSGAAPPALSTVEMNQLLADAVSHAANHPYGEDKQVAFTAAPSEMYAELYEPWFYRIIDNLIANALTHNPEGTHVTVELSQLGPSELQITLRDNGNGMDEETAAMLFERYYRGTDTDSEPEGSGLGMAIAKALTETLRGRVEVETAPGRGTAIRLRFPLAPPPPA
ncbi:sensor histidine kinase [Paenibacillaceae bacterium]|nr:sensor histidine kinase [Paenibacillaceae bacterium]